MSEEQTEAAEAKPSSPTEPAFVEDGRADKAADFLRALIEKMGMQCDIHLEWRLRIYSDQGITKRHIPRCVRWSESYNHWSHHK